MRIDKENAPSLPQFRRHPRDWRDHWYVYPVISRRSRGLSIGVNLNPDMACNFDCVYCQVDRTVPAKTRTVDLNILRGELERLLAQATSGALFNDLAFQNVPQEWRRISDIAFSGDGEPTTCKHFAEAVSLAATIRQAKNLMNTKLVLITDACYLTKPQVASVLPLFSGDTGEIWAKLDAGTEAYYQQVNRPSHPLQHVMDNIIAVARKQPVVIQSLFMRLSGRGPDEQELWAYTDRLHEIVRAGGHLSYVQVYTTARQPAEPIVSALSDSEVDCIASLVHERTNLRVEFFYGR